MKRIRSLTTSATKNCLFPRRKILNGVAPHPSPLPRGKRVKLENQLRGRGDNRQKSHSFISDRVKYNPKRQFGSCAVVLIPTRSASEANKLCFSFGVKYLPRWRFGLVFFAVTSLPVTTVSQKCATSKLTHRVRFNSTACKPQ